MVSRLVVLAVMSGRVFSVLVGRLVLPNLVSRLVLPVLVSRCMSILLLRGLKARRSFSSASVDSQKGHRLRERVFVLYQVIALVCFRCRVVESTLHDHGEICPVWLSISAIRSHIHQASWHEVQEAALDNGS